MTYTYRNVYMTYVCGIYMSYVFFHLYVCSVDFFCHGRAQGDKETKDAISCRFLFTKEP